MPTLLPQVEESKDGFVPLVATLHFHLGESCLGTLEILEFLSLLPLRVCDNFNDSTPPDEDIPELFESLRWRPQGKRKQRVNW